jgi:UDP-glucose 4-epimerase
MRILVTGGAGYIGSHMVRLLAERGDEVTVLDDLSTGHADAVRGAQLVQGDVADSATTTRLLRDRKIEAVVHFAGVSQVGESVANPAKYQARNVGASAALLRAMGEAGVRKIVFSSTAAVYGEPQRLPIDEDHPTRPLNPYGATKLEVERMLAEAGARQGLSASVLRYFNAAGAEPRAGLGERHDPETHLIPLVLRAAAQGRAVAVFGNDYPTRDGSCVRDYVHVSDLCAAHLLALERLEARGTHECFNLGTGEGASVLQVIEAARRITRRELKIIFSDKRPGDPAALVADPAKARRILGWQAVRSGIETIVRDAWEFEQQVLSRSI